MYLTSLVLQNSFHAGSGNCFRCRVKKKVTFTSKCQSGKDDAYEYYRPVELRGSRNNNLNIKNPFSEDVKVKTDPAPRIKAEGKAGQSTEMGVIFVMSSNFLSEPGSEWIVGTCFKSPCVCLLYTSDAADE